MLIGRWFRWNRRRLETPLLISPSPARGNQLNFRFYRSPQRAKSFARLRTRFETRVLLKPGSDTGFQKGISRPAGRDSGLCPENPQAFRERLERKLQLGVQGFSDTFDRFPGHRDRRGFFLPSNLRKLFARGTVDTPVFRPDRRSASSAPAKSVWERHTGWTVGQQFLER